MTGINSARLDRLSRKDGLRIASVFWPVDQSLAPQFADQLTSTTAFPNRARLMCPSLRGLFSEVVNSLIITITVSQNTQIVVEDRQKCSEESTSGSLQGQGPDGAGFKVI